MSFSSSWFHNKLESVCCWAADSKLPIPYLPSSPNVTTCWCQQHIAAPAPPALAAIAPRKRTHSDDEPSDDEPASKRARPHEEAISISDEPQSLLTRVSWTVHKTLKQTTTTTLGPGAPSNAHSESDSECPICRETLFWCPSASDGAAECAPAEWSLSRHECGNTFHSTCLDTWCTAPRGGATTCPMCRGVILDPPVPHSHSGQELQGPAAGLGAEIRLELFGGAMLSRPAVGQPQQDQEETPGSDGAEEGFLSEKEARSVLSFLAMDMDGGGFGIGLGGYEDNVDVSDLVDEA